MSALFKHVAASFVFLSSSVIAQQPTNVTSCNAVLAKDYYAYASKNHLAEDYVQSLDQESYNQIKDSNSFSLSALTQYGPFKVGDDFNHFSENRSKYLESTHYNRTQDDAKNILTLTTSDRAYSAYEACLRSIGANGGVLVWAETESPKSIDLHVKYANPPGVRSAVLKGTIDGGSVSGAPAHLLWTKVAGKWRVSEEKVFTILPSPGVSDTKIMVQASDGSAPVILHFKRADALLSVDFQGTTPVLRFSHQTSTAVSSPNNDHNSGSCPNMVGRDSGKWCISRTRVSMSIAPPRFYKSPLANVCTGIGCPFGGWSLPVQLENGNQTVSAEFDNHGAAVGLSVSADVWENVGSDQCGGSQGPVPVNFNQAVIFAVPDECKSIATLRMLHLPDGSQGLMPFDHEHDDDLVLLRKSSNSAGGVTTSAFVVSH